MIRSNLHTIGVGLYLYAICMIVTNRRLVSLLLSTITDENTRHTD